MLTPSQLESRSEFYHQLGTLLSAGVAPVQAIEHLREHPVSPVLGTAASTLLTGLNRGLDFAEACEEVDGVIPTFDLALLHAGEQSGRLDQVMAALARVYRERATLLRQSLSQLAYPLLILHAGVFISPLPTLVLTGNVTGYLLATAGVLAPAYALTAAAMWACDGRHGAAWRGRLESVARCIPILGAARRDLALSRFALALGSLLNAGVPVVRSWSVSADASGSPALSKAVEAKLSEIEHGSLTPGEMANGTPEFPSLFATSLLTAEASGKIDDTLSRLQRYYAEEGSRQMTLFAALAPRLVYMVILFVLAAQILDMFTAQQKSLPSF